MTSKYRNRVTVVDGIKFASRREAERYQQLRMLERAGEISGLRLQVPFDLAGRVRIAGRWRPTLRYVADFVYVDDRGRQVVEDSKGHRTEGYRIKRHLMADRYGIEIRET